MAAKEDAMCWRCKRPKDEHVPVNAPTKHPPECPRPPPTHYEPSRVPLSAIEMEVLELVDTPGLSPYRARPRKESRFVSAALRRLEEKGAARVNEGAVWEATRLGRRTLYLSSK